MVLSTVYIYDLRTLNTTIGRRDRVYLSTSYCYLYLHNIFLNLNYVKSSKNRVETLPLSILTSDRSTTTEQPFGHLSTFCLMRVKLDFKSRPTMLSPFDHTSGILNKLINVTNFNAVYIYTFYYYLRKMLVHIIECNRPYIKREYM